METGVNKKEINSDIIRLMLPTVMENMLQILATVVITAMVGRLLARDISAQGISNRIYSICFAFFRGLGVGATVIVARYFGARNLAKCRRVIEQTYLTCAPILIIFMLIVFAFPQQILSFFTTDPEILNAAVAYSRITVWAIPFMAVMTLNAAAFNGHSDTKTPMYIAIVVNLVNVAVGYVFIFGAFGVGGWGITGAAIATVVSQASGCLLGLFLLYRPVGIHAITSHGQSFFSIDKDDVKNIYSTGVPAALESAFWTLSSVVMSKIIISYGSNYYAAYELGLQAEFLTEIPAMGFITASTTLSARLIGQRDGNLYRAYFSSMTRMAVALSALAAGLMMLFPGVFMSLLTDKSDLQQIGAVYVFWMGFCQISQIITKVFYGFIRSSGGTRVPMYITFFGIWIIRMPLALLVGWGLRLDIIFIWIVICVDQTLRLAISIIYMKRKDITHTIERIEAEEAAKKSAAT